MTTAWYDDEAPLVEVVHEAVASNTKRREIVDELNERRFPETTRRRVETIVAGAVERRTPDAGKASPSQPTQSNDPPRSVPTRFAAYGDLEHLGDREFARLLGFVLERFEGNTVSPLLDALDLLWHRQSTTVGIRAVADQDPEPTLEAIQEVATGETNPPDARSPSRLVVVTVARIDEELAAAAVDTAVELCGRAQVARWLRIAQVPPSAYGPLLEEGEQSSFDTDSVLDEVPPLPSRAKGRDPLDMDGSEDAIDIATWNHPRDDYHQQLQTTESGDAATQPHSEPDSSATAASGPPSRDTTHDGYASGENASAQTAKLDFDAQPSEGKYGRLYADPDEDGDVDEFDEWTAELEEGS